MSESTDLSPARIASEAVFLVRELVNTPPNLLSPEAFVNRVLERIRDVAVSAEILDEQQLVDQGFGGISAVGQGSVNPPRLMMLRYTPAAPTRRVALVGKGITFDSGGLSLKPAGSMVGMKYDMRCGHRRRNDDRRSPVGQRCIGHGLLMPCGEHAKRKRHPPQ